MPASLANRLYMIFNVASSTIWSMGGPGTASANPIQSFQPVFPPLGSYPNQVWTVQQSSSNPGYYTLWNVYHPNFMSMNTTATNSQVWLTQHDGTDNQLWNITRHYTFQYPDYFTMTNKFSGNSTSLQYTGAGSPVKGQVPSDTNPYESWIFVPA